MRIRFALLSLLSAVAFVSAETAASPQTEHKLRQVTRRELVARAKYPEHFGRAHLNRREEGGEGQGQVEPPVPEPSGGPSGPCPLGELNNPTPGRRREFVADQVLSPNELVAFLKGRGEFVS